VSFFLKNVSVCASRQRNRQMDRRNW